MRIHVKGYLTYRKSIGDRWISLEADQALSIRKLLELLRYQCDERLIDQILDGKTGRLKSNVAILINGRTLTSLPGGLDWLLTDQDEVAIFPPLMGGCCLLQ